MGQRARVGYNIKMADEGRVECNNESISKKLQEYTMMYDNENDWFDDLDRDAIEKLLKEKEKMEDTSQFFKYFPADKATFTKEEFIRGIMGSSIEEIFGELCKKYDNNGDGILSADEIVSALQDSGFPKPTTGAVEKLMKKCDDKGNKDGKVTYDEFIVGFLQDRWF